MILQIFHFQFREKLAQCRKSSSRFFGIIFLIQLQRVQHDIIYRCGNRQNLFISVKDTAAVCRIDQIITVDLLIFYCLFKFRPMGYFPIGNSAEQYQQHCHKRKKN